MQREFLAGNYLLSLESAGRTAARVQEIDLYRLPEDYYKTYAARVSSVGANQIKSLDDKYLGNPDKGDWDNRRRRRGKGDQGAVRDARSCDGVRHGFEGGGKLSAYPNNAFLAPAGAEEFSPGREPRGKRPSGTAPAGA